MSKGIRLRRRVIGAVLVLALATSLVPLAGSSFANTGTTVFVNEIHYDNAGTDVGEAIEVAGPAGTDLSGWSLVLYNGSGGAVYDTIPLSGVIPNQEDGMGTLAFDRAGIQNGSPDGLALVNGTTVVQFLSYEGDFTAVGGPAGGMASTDIGVEEASSTPEGDSLQLVGTGSTYENFTWNAAAASTFGAVNTGQVFSAADVPPEVIGTTPDDGDTFVAVDAEILIDFSEDVTVTGSWFDVTCADSGSHAATVSGGPQSYTLVPDIVFANDEECTVTVYASQVADQDDPPDNMAEDYDWSFTTTPLATDATIYEIQYTTDPSGDSPYLGQLVRTDGIVTAFFYAGGDRLTFIQDGTGPWNGLALYDPNGFVNVGDDLEVIGVVSEDFGLTVIENAEIALLSEDNPLPAPEVLDSGAVSQEQWESVLVRVESATVTDDDLGFGEWAVDDGSGDARVDDLGSYAYSPVNGDVIVYVQGPLFYSFGDFKIEPRDNDDIDAEVCGNSSTPVYDIQGSGDESPLKGALVSTEAVVTGDFQGGDRLNGFFVQDPDGDADDLTSDGIFVYAPGAADVAVGDHVRVRGEVAEYYGLTELTYVSSLLQCDPVGAVDPTPALAMPVSAVADWERQEGMLIEFSETLYATDNYNLGRYGEVDLSVGDRQYQPTNVVEPGADAIAMQDLNDRSRIQLEDGSRVQNPLPLPPYLGPDNTLRAGDTTEVVIGCLSYDYGRYELHPTQEVSFARVNEREAAPAETNGKVEIAAFNVLNYFTTLDNSGPICGPEENQDCRGADTPEEFVRQRDKIIDAILKLDADVIGLMELENHPGDVPIADLVTGLNGDASVASLLAGVESGSNGPAWAYIPTGAIGTDAIRVGFIYKPARVTPVGDYAILDSTVDPGFIDALNRPALAQTFELTTGGARFTAAVNHLKSKSSDCDDYGDPDIGDGQGYCNQTRTQAATALANWLATDPTGSGDSDFLIIGDLNSYAMEDPIVALEDSGFTDLVEHFVDPVPYSYVYFGQAGYLDHSLASPDAFARTMGTTVWHINADEPSALDYNNYNQPGLYNPDAFRSSDHDPVLVGFCDFIPPELEVSVSPEKLWPPNHKYVEVKADVTATDNIDPDPDIELVAVTSNEPDNGLGDGDTENDIVILDDFTFNLRAERAGPKSAYEGDGRIYYITYKATDDCGNSTTTSAMVWVPHDMGKGGK